MVTAAAPVEDDVGRVCDAVIESVLLCVEVAVKSVDGEMTAVGCVAVGKMGSIWPTFDVALELVKGEIDGVGCSGVVGKEGSNNISLVVDGTLEPLQGKVDDSQDPIVYSHC